MCSIIMHGHTFLGISVVGRGVFTDDKDGGWTYAGQCKDGYACGLGVTTYSFGRKDYAKHGPDGQFDGRHLIRYVSGHTLYRLYERGKLKDWAGVDADGRCQYNGVGCAPKEPRMLALIAQVAPVEVRLAAPATHPPLRPQAIVRSVSRFVFHPQALAKATATEVHSPAARRR
jgi:hypothetical protein